jgi:Zn-dependent protease with chaperone function
MKPAEGPSLSNRAFLAASLVAGFYLLVLSMVGGLAFGAWWLVFQIRPFSIFMMVCGAGMAYAALRIIWSSFPRRIKFETPGILLDPRKHPKLFEELRRISRDTRQRMPSEVYLIADVNAWVSHRGSFLGLFPKRIMGLGLPLFKVLTQSQFRSVIVHEFGHYVGGDTKLGPWIYRTHAAIARTVEALEGNDSIWRFPFLAYAKMFTRVSLSVAQQQELAADALAAKIAGAKATAQALRATENAGNAFPGFISDEFLPILNAEFRAPLCEGFAQYMANKDVARMVMRRLGRELADRKRDPHRTHPPLGVRLEAVAAQPPGFESREDPPALELISELDVLERDLVVFVTSNDRIRTLPMLAWSDAGEKAYLPKWREQAESVRQYLRGITADAVLGAPLTEIGKRIERQAADPDARRIAMGAIGSALMVSLRDLGWTIRMEPGERPSIVRDDVKVYPFSLFYDLAEGKLTSDAWRETVKKGGIEGLNLGPVT